MDTEGDDVKTCIAAVIVSLTLAFAQNAAAQASAPETTTAPDITPQTKVYTRDQVPSGNFDIYPPKAQDEEVRGFAVLACHIADDMRPDKCVVLSETPQGYGFGKAAALAILRYGKVDPAKQKSGDWVKQTFTFSLNG